VPSHTIVARRLWVLAYEIFYILLSQDSNGLVFAIDTCFVFYEVQTEFLNMI